MSRFRVPSIAALLSVLMATAGCTHFLIRPDDGALTKTVKILSRTVGGIGTLGGTEFYIAAEKKNEALLWTTNPEERLRLEEERDSIIAAYWLMLGVIIIVGVIIAVVAASDGNSGGGGRTYQEVIHTVPGTCSWHGGVMACIDGVAVCADGEYSPGMQPSYVTWE
jgi:hypothetical protein